MLAYLEYSHCHTLERAPVGEGSYPLEKLTIRYELSLIQLEILGHPLHKDSVKNGISGSSRDMPTPGFTRARSTR